MPRFQKPGAVYLFIFDPVMLILSMMLGFRPRQQCLAYSSGWVLLLLLFALSSGTGRAAQSEKGVLVELNFAYTNPGGEVVLPVNFFDGSDRKINEVSTEISFESRWLEFVDAMLMEAVGGAGAQVSSEVLEGDNPGESKVKVSVRSDQPFPNADLFRLIFRASEDGEPESTVSIRIRATASTKQGVLVEEVKTRDGEVIFAEGPLPQFGCFFYMH